MSWAYFRFSIVYRLLEGCVNSTSSAWRGVEAGFSLILFKSLVASVKGRALLTEAELMHVPGQDLQYRCRKQLARKQDELLVRGDRNVVLTYTGILSSLRKMNK